jgi:anti-sigma-K factor RskA
MEHDAIHELTAAYAVDALDPEEADAFERHLAGCERCREELAALSATATALVYAAPAVEPPARLREAILDAARAERPNVVPLAPRRSRTAAVLGAVAAVAACLAVGLGIWNVVLHDRLGDARQALRTAPLQGASGSLVVGPSGKGVLVVAGLEPAPAGRTYEAWVVRGGTAEPAGTFPGGGTSVVRLDRPVPDGAVVAVTVEPAGGSAQPTTKPFIASQPV